LRTPPQQRGDFGKKAPDYVFLRPKGEATD